MAKSSHYSLTVIFHNAKKHSLKTRFVSKKKSTKVFNFFWTKLVKR